MADLDWNLILKLTVVATTILLWVSSNDRDVAKATRPDAEFPWWHAIVGALVVGLLPGDLIERDWLAASLDTVVAAMCARVLWHWWRRRRRGKPSRVLGLVRDLGHRLTVVAVPASKAGRG